MYWSESVNTGEVMAFTLNASVCEARSVQRVSAGNRPRVLVTGASSGIGAEFARHFARTGHDLVLVARNESTLQQLAIELGECGVDIQVVVADLSCREGVEAVGARCGEVDVVVANAGVTHAAAVGSTSRDELDAITYLLSTGVVRLCEILVPPMVRRGRGDVIIVSSIAAFTPMRKSAVYAAAKSHVTAYARSLALEVMPRGVGVVSVCPGYVRTDLHRRANLDHLVRRVPGWMWLDPDVVVQASVQALRRGKVVVVPGLVYRLVLPFLSSTPVQAVWRRLTRRR